MRRIQQHIRFRIQVLRERANDMRRVRFISQLPAIAEPNAPCCVCTAGARAVVVRKSEAKWCGGRTGAGCEPAALNIGEFEVDFCAHVDMAFVDGALSQGREWWGELNVTQAVSAPRC